jgi:hypothetical protein
MKPPEYEIALCAFRRGKEVLKGHLYKLCKWGGGGGGGNERQGLLGGIGGLEMETVVR